ncbi:MAG TPA: M36 family metallopeptidase [Thermoanaerobaculia bacterium]|nr:M36 family metallopeptidase [Thermoanaerobaculia bacterium]
MSARAVRRPSSSPVVLLATLFTLAAGAARAQPVAPPGPPDAPGERRNFDARPGENAGFEQPPAPFQVAALERLRERVPELLVTFDPASGVTRSLWNAVGTLTDEPAPGDPIAVTESFLAENLDLLGLDPGDLDDFVISDLVFSRQNGALHLYLLQVYAGIPVYNGQLQVHLDAKGRVISVNNDFAPRLGAAVNVLRAERGAEEAVASALRHLGLEPVEPAVVAGPEGDRQETHLDPAGVSREPIVARLVWVPVRRGIARLAWNFQLHTLDGRHVYDFTVDAVSGRVWTRIDWVSEATYEVYPQPIESPNHITPLPPADARWTIQDPHLQAPNASPLGWHNTGSSSFTILRGNNVHAYEDRDNNGAPPFAQPSCGSSLACVFAVDLTADPTAYIPAALTNLFYWNNLIHDVQYQYGFDEAAGNFQVNNFGRGGAGGDDVRAEALDGGGTNNAFFFTPPDGQRPRMEMYVWTHANPDRTSDFDNLVITHEYGHGISNRLVGGPSNVSCLGNLQQPGEGWSDWFGLVYTSKPGHDGPLPRGGATYLLNQPTSGAGIRGQRYSTDPAVNTWTYASINGQFSSHAIGSVWAQALWEVYWKLVDAYGHDPELHNASGGAGNHRALLYVTEGLKLTACSPTFLNARDGIIQAATSLYGGADVCLLWEAFAGVGLGSNATTGGPHSNSATNGFTVPSSCQFAQCNGTSGQWQGCRGTGCHVCAEKVASHPLYFVNHPGCIRNTNCQGLYFTCNANCPAPGSADACNGTSGQWQGCRGTGCSVCAEKVSAYPLYFKNHPACIPNTTCNGSYFTCNVNCPAPTVADQCNGSPGQWNGCRGTGCHVCAELVADYPCYFQNHPLCNANTTCGGLYFRCNENCPAPTERDRC